MATASTESKITYIDGDLGVLLYRGYPVEQLAEKSSFLEVANLLINGTLPSKAQLCTFQNSITRHTMVNEQLLRFFQGFHHDAHPMAMVSAVVASMAAFYQDTTDIDDPRHREIFAHRIVAKTRKPSPPRPTSTRSVNPSSIRATICATARTCSTCSSRFPASRMRSTRWRLKRWISCSFCTRITSKTPARRRCALAGSTGANPYAAISAGVVRGFVGTGAWQRQ